MEETKATEANIARRALRCSLHRPRFLSGATILLAVLVLGGLATPSLKAQEPQRDPAGVATGDKTRAEEAGGNFIVVTKPPGKTAPYFAVQKKQYDQHP